MIGQEMLVKGTLVDHWFVPLKGELPYMALLVGGHFVILTRSGMGNTSIFSTLKRRLNTILLENMIILVLSTELDTRMDNVIVG